MKGGGNRGSEGHGLSAVRMIELERMRVEREAFVIADLLAVFCISDDGPSLISEVDADLIFTTGQKGDLN